MANNKLDGKIKRDELLDERQLDNVVGGFNFASQLNGEGLDKIREQFNRAIFGNPAQGIQRPN